MADSGSASTLTGRPNDSASSVRTNGMRDEPPTSSTREMSALSRPAVRTARSSACTVSARRKRIIDSSSRRVTTTSRLPRGVATGTTVSVSADRRSLARRQSARSRESIARLTGSSASISVSRSLASSHT